MSPLSQADREWVQLTVKTVIAECMKEHVRTCPNAARLRVFVFGLLCGVGVLSGPGVVAAVLKTFAAQ